VRQDPAILPAGAHPRARSLRKVAFAVHAWLGIKLSLLLAIVLVSGTAATVSHELDWLLNPAIRVAPERAVAPDAMTPRQWARAADAAQRAFPQGTVDWIDAPRMPGFAVEAVVALPDDRRLRVYVDPTNGEVQGHTSYFNVQRFLRSLHYTLFIEQWGIYVVSSLGLLLLGSLASGLIVYRRFWRGFATLPRRAATSRQRWGDLHKLAGLWSIPFTLLIALTAVWYLVEAAMFDIDVGPRETQSWALDRPAATALPLDRLVAAAQAEHPRFRIRSIHFPDGPGDALRLDGQTEALLVRDRANKLFLDPATGRTVHHHYAADLDPVDRWVHTADPLHFGDFGGLATKLLWFGFGLLLCGLQLSGTMIWWKRLRRAAEAEGTTGALATLRPGLFAVLAVALLAAMLAGGYAEISGYFA